VAATRAVRKLVAPYQTQVSAWNEELAQLRAKTTHDPVHVSRGAAETFPIRRGGSGRASGFRTIGAIAKDHSIVRDIDRRLSHLATEFENLVGTGSSTS
jgi:hypothetical protein